MGGSGVSECQVDEEMSSQETWRKTDASNAGQAAGDRGHLADEQLWRSHVCVSESCKGLSLLSLRPGLSRALVSSSRRLLKNQSSEQNCTTTAGLRDFQAQKELGSTMYRRRRITETRDQKKKKRWLGIRNSSVSKIALVQYLLPPPALKAPTLLGRTGTRSGVSQSSFALS